MKILESIVQEVEKGVGVKAVKRGYLWTGVVSKRCGLASALNEGQCVNPSDNKSTDIFTEKKADALASFIFSDIISEASLGMAAINSLIEPDLSKCVEFNAKEYIVGAGKGKNVTIIGHFPFVDDVRKEVQNLWVVEKKPKHGDLSEEEGKKYLPISDVVAITSTSFINHTIENILDLCSPESIKILLGPSTPMTPMLFDFGIDILSGSLVTDKSLVFDSITKGLSFSAMKRRGGIKLVNLVRDKKKLDDFTN